MKKPSAKIRQEITKLQEQLKQVETREAERIGRLALKAGLGDIEVEDTDLIAAFEELAQRFRGQTRRAPQAAEHAHRGDADSGRQVQALTPGATDRNAAEA
ncbi:MULTISPECIES: conjugal transfer protein TraC [unclassified Rhizobium]|uniref:conjugal transfer protein TraC n=1 Tax=unclassified Rhizobium TaxID=2613769 RepID=UPI003806A728